MRTGERGQAAAFVIGMALVTFAVAGVAIDGTRAFLHRRTLQAAADAAVLDAAQSIQSRALYARSQVRISPASARAAALGSLGARGLGGTEVSISADEGRVVVVVRSRVPTTFLGLAGIGSIPVAVEAAAAPLRVP